MRLILNRLFAVFFQKTKSDEFYVYKNVDFVTHETIHQYQVEERTLMAKRIGQHDT